MPFNDITKNHFSEEEKKTITNAFKTLKNTLTPKLANLSSEERQRFGSVNEQNKLLVNKTKNYQDTQPSLSTSPPRCSLG